MSGWLDAGPVDPAHPGEVRTVPGAPVPLAVAHVDGRWYAFDDACPHHDCPLADGYLDGSTIECECHGSVFDVATGAVLRGPAVAPIGVHAVEEQHGRVRVRPGC